VGYYTNYTLTADPEFMEVEIPLGELVTESHLLTEAELSRKVPKTVEVVDEVTKILREGYGDPFDENCKWYEHKRDMLAASLQFPGVLLKLAGLGEANEDMWVEYYRDGKVQVCKAVVTYPEFDEAKLK